MRNNQSNKEMQLLDPLKLSISDYKKILEWRENTYPVRLTFHIEQTMFTI